jgi:hypothetical protein
VPRQVAREQTRIDVVAAADGLADDEGEGFVAAEVGVGGG